MNRIACGSVMHDVTPCATFHFGPIWCPNACDRPKPALVIPRTDIQAASWQWARRSSASGAVGSTESGRCSRSRPSPRDAVASLERVVPARIHRLDGVVEGAHAGGCPQPLGRAQRDGRIGDHRPRREPRVVDGPLRAGVVVGDAGNRRELPRRQRRGDGDVRQPVAARRRAQSSGTRGSPAWRYRSDCRPQSSPRRRRSARPAPSRGRPPTRPARAGWPP